MLDFFRINYFYSYVPCAEQLTDLTHTQNLNTDPPFYFWYRAFPTSALKKSLRRNTAARSLNASFFERNPCLPIRCSLHIGLVPDHPFTACTFSFPSTLHVKQQIAYKLLHHLLGQVMRQDKTKIFGGSECAWRVCTWSGVWGTAWQLQQPLGARWWNFPFLSPSFHSAFWLLKLSISFFSLFPCQLFSIPSTCFSAFNSRVLPCEMLLSSLVDFLLLQVFSPLLSLISIAPKGTKTCSALITAPVCILQLSSNPFHFHCFLPVDLAHSIS